MTLREKRVGKGAEDKLAGQLDLDNQAWYHSKDVAGWLLESKHPTLLSKQWKEGEVLEAFCATTVYPRAGARIVKHNREQGRTNQSQKKERRLGLSSCRRPRWIVLVQSLSVTFVFALTLFPFSWGFPPDPRPRFARIWLV